jgi:hypothetical protein
MNPIHLVAHSDDWVSGRIHGWRPPRWVQVWMVAATRLGDGWVWLALVVLAPARGDGRTAHVLAEALVAIVAVNTAQVALKRAFRAAHGVGLRWTSRTAVLVPQATPRRLRRGHAHDSAFSGALASRWPPVWAPLARGARVTETT